MAFTSKNMGDIVELNLSGLAMVFWCEKFWMWVIIVHCVSCWWHTLHF